MKHGYPARPVEVMLESSRLLAAPMEALKGNKDKSLNPTLLNFWRFYKQISGLHSLSINLFQNVAYNICCT